MATGISSSLHNGIDRWSWPFELSLSKHFKEAIQAILRHQIFSFWILNWVYWTFIQRYCINWYVYQCIKTILVNECLLTS